MDYEFESGTEINELIAKSSDRYKMVDILTFINNRLNAENTPLSGYMWQSLSNHVAAMIERSITGEVLDQFEESIFAEISTRSIEFARDVVDMIGNLPESEKYLLSVHFERAKLES